jgi:predicted nucleic-acid-binding Zn-ribbon protein
MNDVLQCEKCNSDMEKGYIYDDYKGRSGWIQTIPSALNLKDIQPLISYRCKACGYVESYAQ